MFEMIYDNDYEQTGSKEVALVNAFRIFSTCPRLKELTPTESRVAIKVLLAAPDPKFLINKIIMKLNSKTMLKAFRDTTFLKQFVDTALRYQRTFGTRELSVRSDRNGLKFCSLLLLYIFQLIIAIFSAKTKTRLVGVLKHLALIREEPLACRFHEYVLTVIGPLWQSKQ
jgi:hypothetical protein